MNSGLGKLASLIKDEQMIASNCLLIDNGDMIQGTPLTYHYAKFLADTEHPAITLMNSLHYDAAILGNHEFNFGLDLLTNVVSQSNFPWLSANIVMTDGTPFVGKPYFIKELPNKLRVVILGVTTHYIPNWEDPNHIEGLRFQDAFETVNNWLDFIKENETYDLLIVSYHGGLERDPVTGKETELFTGENQGYLMCTELEGIDVLLTGHQHRALTAEINGVTVVQPSYNGQALGKVTIDFAKDKGKWSIIQKTAELIHVTEKTETDQALLNLVQSYEQQTQQWLDQPIGRITFDMEIRNPFEVRLKDHPLIEFINKVQMDAAGANISSTALFDNHSRGFPQEITMRDIVSNYIYPNTLKVIEIKGQDIKDALEQSATYFSLNEKQEIIINPHFVEPKPQHYNYDMWEGIEYELNISKPVGERVVQLNYMALPIQMDQTFEVVMNNYRAGGGGNFPMFKDKRVVKEIQIDMTELIANYILKRKTIHATCDGNWKVTK
jgi:2',3'-cyclic-nucleotide 2'-phosphodiesterase/3'-nucleotidase